MKTSEIRTKVEMQVPNFQNMQIAEFPFFSFFSFLSEKNHTQNENVRTPITVSIVSKHSLQHTIPFSPPHPTLTLMPLPMNGGLKMLQIP